VVPSRRTVPPIPLHSCVNISYLKEDVNGCPVAVDCPVTAHHSYGSSEEALVFKHYRELDLMYRWGRGRGKTT